MAGADHLRSSRKTSREDEMFCEACDKEGTYAEADGFCVNCMDYLCIVCIKYHRKYMPDHVQQNRANMPPDFATVRCEIHPHDLIKFYCAKCEGTACSKCWKADHKQCGERRHLPTHLRHTNFTYEWKDLKKAMREVSEGLNIVKGDADASLRQASFNRSDVLAAISKRKEEMKKTVENQRLELFDEMDRYRAEVIRKLDKEQNLRKNQLISYQKQLHQRIDEEAARLATASGTDQVKLQGLSEKTGNKMIDFRSLSNDLGKKESRGQRSQLFIAMKKAFQDINNYKDEINRMSTENDTIFYQFVPDENCNIHIDNPDMEISLGSIKAVREYPYVDM